jgi:hypothetical protein
MCVISYAPQGKSPRYPFHRWLHGPQSQSGPCAEENISFPVFPGRTARSVDYTDPAVGFVLARQQNELTVPAFSWRD